MAMANEKDSRKNREEGNRYQAARKRIRTGGRTDTVKQAMAKGELPPPIYAKGAAQHLTELAEGLPLEVLGDDWEQMNYRQMVLGQHLQQIAHRTLKDPEWQAMFIKGATPNDVAKWIDMGVKIERQAASGVLEMKKRRENEKNKAGEVQGLAHKAIQNPELMDAIHDLIDDDAEDDE